MIRAYILLLHARKRVRKIEGAKRGAKISAIRFHKYIVKNNESKLLAYKMHSIFVDKEGINIMFTFESLRRS